MTRAHKLFGWLVLLIVVWLMSGCGGPSPSLPPAAASAPVQSLRTGRTLVVGGDEVFDRDAATGRLAPHDYGACVDNDGIANGDSYAIAGALSLGILNAYPSRVILVSNAFELTYAERGRTLDNLTNAVLTATASGAHVTLVGVAGADQFNGDLRNITRAYGAEFVETMPEVTCK